MKVFHKEVHDGKSEDASVCNGNFSFQLLEAKDPKVLDGIGYFGSKKDNHPADLDPNEEKGKGGKASINGSIPGNPNLEINVDELDQVVDCGGDQSRKESRSKLHFHTGHKHVEKS